MRNYKVLRDSPEWDAKKDDELELDLDPVLEDEYVASGRVELAEAEYEVVGESVVDGNQPGEKFVAVMPLGREQLLVEGGHIKKVEKKSAAKSKAKEAKS